MHWNPLNSCVDIRVPKEKIIFYLYYQMSLVSFDVEAPLVGGVLLYINYMGMCHCEFKGMVFIQFDLGQSIEIRQVWSRIGCYLS